MSCLPHIRIMTPADLQLAMRLKQQAGWNQLEADWRRALDLEPFGCFVATWNGVPVGTTTCCIFPWHPVADATTVSWIALVLVEKSVRGQGIGRALLQHTLDYLDARGVASVWLDATPLGQPLYEKLGFARTTTFLRYEGRPALAVRAASLACGCNVTPGTPADVQAVLELDQAVYGYERARLIQRLVEEDPPALRVCRRHDSLLGYALSRPGANATQFGPCVAADEAGPHLLADALTRLGGKSLFVDVPECNGSVRRLLETLDFQVQRPLVRMVRGTLIPEDMQRIWASSGPEKG